MMHTFLSNNKADLLARCREKVASRAERGATPEQLSGGVPLFLDQLLRTLQAEEGPDLSAGEFISGDSAGNAANSELGVAAAAHGQKLLNLGYTVGQVVHDYGDLCQAITDLADERDAPFSIDEFRTLNRCLDNGIAEAVTAFSYQRDANIETQHDARDNERIGMLVHEFRNGLSTANLAIAALDAGHLTIAGATGTVLKRCMSALTALCNEALNEVRQKGRNPTATALLNVASVLKEASDNAGQAAVQRGSVLNVDLVDETLFVQVDPHILLSAIGNLLQNAFKFTKPGSSVNLRAYQVAQRVHIDVADHCGGLPAGVAVRLFTPFFTHNAKEKSGLGLGLSTSRKNIEVYGGTLTVKDVPGTGCIFTINLPSA